MSTLRIVDAPLLPNVDGTEKIPTGGRGDYAISVDQIKGHIFQDVGKELVGLGNVDNTSDLDKPVSTAQQVALNLKADKTYVDANLDLKADKTNVYTRSETTLSLSQKADLVDGVVPSNQLPSYVDDVVEYTTNTLPIIGESGKIYVTTDTNRTWRWSGNQYVEISNGGVSDSTLKLQTPRKIANVDFDGTQNIDIPHNNLKGRDAAGTHPASAILDASGASQQEINDYCPTVLQLNSAIKGDGVTDDAPALQVLASSVDIDLKAYMFFPFYNNNYKLGSTVAIQEPMMLWGDAVPTYNRGDGKKGKILLNTPIGFNLGNGRTNGAVLDLGAKTSKNGADQWTVKNLAFLPFNRATQEYTQTAIMFDSKNNGPDRGFIMREVSASRVKHAIHVKDNDVQTHLSNLEVVNCCFSNNLIPVLADGNVWCGRIVNSQIEQNYEGAIHGVFHAGLTIHDNMLEGCRNTIYIKDHPRDRDGCYLSLQRNYFELNSGDYLVKMDSYQANSIISRGNYVSGFMSSDGITPETDRNRPTDHFLLTNSYSSIYIYDSLSVSFFGLVTCAEDNNLKRFLVYAQPSSFVKVNTRLNDAKEMGVNVASVRNIANKVNTDVGEVYEVGKSNQYTDIPLSVNANDVVQLVFSYYSDDDALAPSLITIIEAGTSVVLVQGASIPQTKSQGNIKTVNLVFTVPYNATGNRTIRFNLTTTDSAKTLNMIGASAKKIGTYNASAVNTIDNRFIVEKSKPVLRRVADGLKYSDILAESTIANGTTLTKTYTVSGATSSNRVEAVLSSYLADLSVTARVSTVDTVQVVIKNNGAAPVTIPNTTALSYTIY